MEGREFSLAVARSGWTRDRERLVARRPAALDGVSISAPGRRPRGEHYFPRRAAQPKKAGGPSRDATEAGAASVGGPTRRKRNTCTVTTRVSSHQVHGHYGILQDAKVRLSFGLRPVGVIGKATHPRQTAKKGGDGTDGITDLPEPRMPYQQLRIALSHGRG